MDNRLVKGIGKIFVIAASICVMACSCYYDILYDILLIFALFICGYLLGQMLKVNGSIFEKLVMRTAGGVGLIGIGIYFILLMGLGNKSVYLALMVLCLVVSLPFAIKNKQDISETLSYTKDVVMRHWLLTGVLLMVLVVYLMYGSAPISEYDTLTKHLPITIYAAENGRWYTNVTESVVYGEPMVLQYTYTVLFYSLGAYKALILFNVILLFGIYSILAYFIRSIYKKSSIGILAVILLTTPFFFKWSTVFYLEILPIYFMVSAFVSVGKLEEKKIWDNIELITFLCGCAVFVKLTLVFTIVVLEMVLLFYCVRYAIKKKAVKRAFIKMGKCIILAVAPSITSLIHIWYATGNPVFPMYNGIFKSPYYLTENFIDPYSHKLTFSFQSLMDIVFRTPLNIGMYPYGMGIFLLFIFVIPLAVVLLFFKREAKMHVEYVVWSVAACMAYIVNTFTTYNLRYYFAVWILFAGVIVVGISICISAVPVKAIRGILIAAISVILLYPNLLYLKRYASIPIQVVKDERLVKNDFCDGFDIISQEKNILAITMYNQYKGQYRGYFASTSWHCPTARYVVDGKYSWEDYLSSFDYVIVDKTMDEAAGYAGPAMEKLPGFLGEKCYENDSCEIYEVIPQTNSVLDVEYDIPQETSVLQPITDVLQNTQTEYYIVHRVINEMDHPVTMRFQVNWMSEEGEIIDCYISLYDAQPGENVYNSEIIPSNKEADFGIVYVTTADEQKVKISSYSVTGINNVLERETMSFEDRAMLGFNRANMVEEYAHD